MFQKDEKNKIHVDGIFISKNYEWKKVSKLSNYQISMYTMIIKSIQDVLISSPSIQNYQDSKNLQN
jgi:hypothetical protein